MWHNQKSSKQAAILKPNWRGVLPLSISPADVPEFGVWSPAKVHQKVTTSLGWETCPQVSATGWQFLHVHLQSVTCLAGAAVLPHMIQNYVSLVTPERASHLGLMCILFGRRVNNDRKWNEKFKLQINQVDAEWLRKKQVWFPFSIKF